MANKMLIDASHPEETRVVVLSGNRVQEFDFEAADKRPLRGNIYLAKVTRVEPSLQAAFVDYGGNRHGFLAFAEIHPDYYQIPVADQQALAEHQALLEEEKRAHREEEEEENRRPHGRRRSRRRQHESAEHRAAPDEALVSEPLNLGDSSGHDRATEELVASDDAVDAEAGVQISYDAPVDEAPTDIEVETVAVVAEDAHQTISVDPSGFGLVETGVAEEFSESASEPDHEAKSRRRDARDEEREEALAGSTRAGKPGRPQSRRSAEEEHDEDDHEEEEEVEHIGGDAMDEAPYRAPRLRRQYKIQEVIKRRQVLLVQVVKEERGNKGAALTTYLSLAGRYSVLMPNTARGGGISRKITDGADRKRLKEIVDELEVPEGMGIILRTAGASRTKAEVKRDFEYLLRLWDSVRELAIASIAPTLVYEEGSLIKRAIRDLYGRDVEEIVVAGDDAYREAKDFMRMLMPSHAKNVKQHREPFPIFAESGVEAQLDAMFSNHVTLKSGGYLVINQTEALVAIDVNSGRSTREHNIEDTALRTNLEAADEVARQLRLRDLAGLIVVDFIDMEEGRNNRAVERRLKEALRNDRARIQVGRISHFGLLEMSRQRIRAGVIEGSTVPCPHCAGAGHVRSTASIALHVLRVLEEALVKSAAHDVTLRTRAVVALYILNQKRAHLYELERRFGVHITVAADDTLTGANYHALERGEVASGPRLPPATTPLRVDSLPLAPPEEEEVVDETIVASLLAEDDGDEAREGGDDPRRGTQGSRVRAGDEADDDAPRGRRRRRRRGRGGGAHPSELMPLEAEQPPDDGLALMAAIEGAPAPRESRPARGGRDRGGFEKGAGRGPGRWRRSAPLPDEFLNPAGDFPSDAGIGETPVGTGETHMPDFETEMAPGAVARVVPNAPGPAAWAPALAPAAALAESLALETAHVVPVAQEPAPTATHEPAPAEPGEPTQVIITEADPARPRKAGWWQRVRTPFGG
jgi:ribonuclease E